MVVKDSSVQYEYSAQDKKLFFPSELKSYHSGEEKPSSLMKDESETVQEKSDRFTESPAGNESEGWFNKSVVGVMLGVTIAGVAAPAVEACAALPDRQPAVERVIDEAVKKQAGQEIQWKYGADEEYKDFPSVNIVIYRKVAVSSKGRTRHVTKRVYEDISPSILKYGKEYGINPRVIRAVIAIESSFNPRAHSGAGACGLMQVMPSTARMMGVKNYWDPESNIKAGTKYLASLLEEFEDLPTALAAYNAGPNSISSRVDYTRKSYYREFKKAWQEQNV
jgi:hypothetical protein